jgi:hypothetical protein
MNLELRHRQLVDMYSGQLTYAQVSALEEAQEGLLYPLESVNYDIITGLLWFQTRDGRYSIDKDGAVVAKEEV